MAMVKQTLFQYVGRGNTAERICLKVEMEEEIPNKISDPYSVTIWKPSPTSSSFRLKYLIVKNAFL